MFEKVENKSNGKLFNEAMKKLFLPYKNNDGYKSSAAFIIKLLNPIDGHNFNNLHEDKK